MLTKREEVNEETLLILGGCLIVFCILAFIGVWASCHRHQTHKRRINKKNTKKTTAGPTSSKQRGKYTQLDEEKAEKPVDHQTIHTEPPVIITPESQPSTTTTTTMKDPGRNVMMDPTMDTDSKLDVDTTPYLAHTSPTKLWDNTFKTPVYEPGTAPKFEHMVSHLEAQAQIQSQLELQKSNYHSSSSSNFTSASASREDLRRLSAPTQTQTQIHEMPQDSIVSVPLQSGLYLPPPPESHAPSSRRSSSPGALDPHEHFDGRTGRLYDNRSRSPSPHSLVVMRSASMLRR